MDATFKLLEERIQEAVRRLKDLGDEKASLEREILRLRELLETGDAARRIEDDRFSEPRGSAGRVAETLRKAIRDLREV